MFERTFEVTVLHPTPLGVDRLGNAALGEPTPETVQDVMIQSPSTADLEAARTAGYEVAYTLQFPKAYEGSLRGCSVVLPDPYPGTYRVAGDPRPDSNAPTRFANRWNRTVHVEAADG